jgi:hypothetical protein
MSDEVDPRLLEDPLLHRIPGEWPQAFLRLPWSEQRWRGRAFRIAYVVGGSVPFAWSVALNRDPEVTTDNQAAVAEFADEEIAEGLDSITTR